MCWKSCICDYIFGFTCEYIVCNSSSRWHENFFLEIRAFFKISRTFKIFRLPTRIKTHYINRGERIVDLKSFFDIIYFYWSHLWYHVKVVKIFFCCNVEHTFVTTSSLLQIFVPSSSFSNTTWDCTPYRGEDIFYANGSR